MVSLKYALYRLEWWLAKYWPAKRPTHLDIEIASACNLKCTFCPQSLEKKKFPVKFMEPLLFEKIIAEAHWLKIPSIKLNLRGEATLHPEFKELCENIKGKFLDIRLNTNGNYPVALNEIIAETFTEVCFSVDAFMEDTYKSIRVGGNWELLNDYMARLYRLLRGKKG